MWVLVHHLSSSLVISLFKHLSWSMLLFMSLYFLFLLQRLVQADSPLCSSINLVRSNKKLLDAFYSCFSESSSEIIQRIGEQHALKLSYFNKSTYYVLYSMWCIFFNIDVCISGSLKELPFDRRTILHLLAPFLFFTSTTGTWLTCLVFDTFRYIFFFFLILLFLFLQSPNLECA